jgi:hypothetical protein
VTSGLGIVTAVSFVVIADGAIGSPELFLNLSARLKMEREWFMVNGWNFNGLCITF